MLSDKELKKWFKEECKKNPDKHYPVKTLKELGFMRKECKCGVNYWTTHKDRKTCDEPVCSGGFRFIGNSPAENKLTYIEVWKEFSRIFKKLGYTPIKRYPVVARWNPTMDFTIASIAAFQPFVVSGDVEPPANPLVIPQFCLRFGDIDNVGITGSHYTGFIMQGQHAFVSPKQYDINLYLKHIYNWLINGIGITKDEITFHEDAWAGGGNYGPSIEFYSRGLELGNQVYMQYEQTPNGNKELDIKVLDMGAGYERVPWFTHGTSTSYETTFPTVIKKLREITRVEIDEDIMMQFLPYAAYLNVDEVDDIEEEWKKVAKKVNIDVEKLKEAILPQAALYSVAEHTRTLLFALTDGALPSNVGGMYNLRVILRRSLSLIDKYEWKVDLADVCEWHAEFLKPLFPELSENLATVRDILNVEKEKYEATREKTRQIVLKAIEKEITTEQLMELYDSNGIEPELIRQEAQKIGKKVLVPDNFYQLITEKHEAEKQETEFATTKKETIDLPDLPETEKIYFKDYSIKTYDSIVLAIKDKYVILNKTIMYPTSGGQAKDKGTLAGIEVEDIFKQGHLIVHKLKTEPNFKEGDEVHTEIDWERRLQLTQHHTSTHILGAAAKRVLGNHINQASARKDVDKAYLDITHYKTLTEKNMEDIENEANKIINDATDTKLDVFPRTKAEQMYGMEIYQGGAVPGKTIRIVNIPGVDSQACGGSHLNNTSEAQQLKIIKTTKVKDGVIRIIFTAGEAAKKKIGSEQEELHKVASLLDVKVTQIPGRAEELFKKWKKSRKAVKKKQKLTEEELTLSSTEEYGGEILAKTAELVQTQQAHVHKVLLRFKTEFEEFKKQIEEF